MQICAITIGETGRAIGHELAQLAPCAEVRAGGRVTAASLPAARAYVLAAGRQSADHEVAIDAIARDGQAPFLPVIVEHPYLRIGPLFVPGSAGACASCYHRRARQHMASTELPDALAAHYMANPGDEPRGYLPPMLTLAARSAQRLIAKAFTGDTSNIGLVFYTYLLHPQLRKYRVIGIHGCRNCGIGHDERTRTVARMHAALQDRIGEGAWEA